MERSEAVAVLQDIFMNFSGDFIDSIILDELVDEDKMKGCRLRIKGIINSFSAQKMREIAQFYNLHVLEDDGFVFT